MRMYHVYCSQRLRHIRSKYPSNATVTACQSSRCNVIKETSIHGDPGSETVTGRADSHSIDRIEINKPVTWRQCWDQ
jgi:hypothetical protein